MHRFKSMFNRHLLVLLPAVAAAVACSSDPGSVPAFDTGSHAGAESADAGTLPGADVGTARRAASGQRCCYNGSAFQCPDEVACFGGVSLEACLAGCAGSDECVVTKCTDALRHAPAPSGCTSVPADPEFSCD